MSSLLNPLHPGTIFIQKRLGQQTLLSYQLILPPATTITFQIAPPSGRIWIAAIQSMGTPRDVTTNNPVISPLIYIYGRHSMLVSYYPPIALESFYRTPWGVELDIRVNDPAVSTITNNTALTVIFDITTAAIEITEDKYDRYMRLWEGLYNFEMLLGGLKDTDVESIVWLLKTLRPVVPLPVPAPTQEAVTHPTLHEDLGKPIKRTEIP